jgi:hypothetical protein
LTRPIVRHDARLQLEIQIMCIPLWRRTADQLAANAASGTGRLLGRADRLLRELTRLPQRTSTRTLRATRLAADEVDFRNELVARFGKTD